MRSSHSNSNKHLQKAPMAEENDSLTQLRDLERTFRFEANSQLEQIEILRSDLAAERAARLKLAERIGILERSLTLSSAAEVATSRSWAQRVGQQLPEAIRIPVWHAYRLLHAAIFPRSEKARQYRTVLEAARTQRASIREQKRLFGAAMSAKRADLTDIIVFPIVDWHFRIQRPQHIATSLAERGHRVFYLSTLFSECHGEPGFSIIESPHPNVYLCQLRCSVPHPVIYDCEHEPRMALELARGLDLLKSNFHCGGSIEIVQHPFWRQVVALSSAAIIVYDCMDNHSGFNTSTESLLREEEKLLDESDLVITTSAELSKLIAKRRQNTLIRNGGDIDHFAAAPEKLAFEKNRPVVGYFGAISAWFDAALMTRVAAALPEWDFVLVGDTFESEIGELESCENVRFEGEVPYGTLPAYLHAFDVCIIPFEINELIRHTNPVKVYEYLSAGKPVVATPMPELLLLSDLVHIADGHEAFIRQLRNAMRDSGDEEAAARRSLWARDQSWRSRADDLERLIENSFPRVSVIVLCFNNLGLTKACLDSLQRFSAYPSLELILVDNASTDGTPEFLEEYASRRDELPFEKLEIILNDTNLGFAAGNNVGIRRASGEFVVLLNNDTYVTRGWVGDLIRHFRLQLGLGLVGPVTNNIGNEARIPIEYSTMDEMATRSRDHTIACGRNRLSVPTLAFFCVAISREVIEQVGLLDEAFEVGFFEDDDYCRRVRQAGFQIAIAEDVFVHHHLSASFGALSKARRDEIFEANRVRYEEKWGSWKAHRYRSDLPRS